MIDKILMHMSKSAIREKPGLAVLSIAHQGLEKMALSISFAAFLFVAPTTLNTLLSCMHGEWVDQSFSQILSERYGKTVSVRDVRMASWNDIYFGVIKVSSSEGHLLFNASYGNLRLKKFNLFEKQQFETEIRLQDVLFTHEYYKSSRSFKPWNGLLRKPVHIDSLLLEVVQNEDRTFLKIMKSESNDVILEGSLTMGSTGKLADTIHVQFSPWMMVRALF